MSREPEYKRAGYLLPEVIDPPQAPICICIPCDRNHALAFIGQIDMLGYWWTWERDPTKRGKEAARVWREIASELRIQMEKCGVFDMSCGCEEKTIVRQYIGDDGHLHVEYSDGTEEIRDDLDPRFSNPTLPNGPDAPGGAKRCAAANSIVTLLEGLQETQYQALLDGTNLAQTLFNAFVAILSVVLAVPVIAIPAIIGILIVALVNIFLDMTPSDFNNQFTADTWQDLLCILYCNMEEDGSFTEAQWSAVIAECKSEIGGFAGLTWLPDTINAMGVVGLTNAARIGYGGTRDCGECGCSDTWCYLFDFTVDPGEWLIRESEGVAFGVWGSGTGFVYTDATNVQGGVTIGHRQVLLRLNLDAINITRIRVTYDYVGGSFDSTALNAFGIWYGGSSIELEYLTRAEMVDGNSQVGEWSGAGIVMNVIDVTLRSSRDSSAPYTYSGNAIITSIQLEGTGVNPFGEDNC